MHAWQPTPIRDAIVKCLFQYGPMRTRDIAKRLKMPERSIKKSIANTRRRAGTDVFRVSGHVLDGNHHLRVFEVPDTPGKHDAPAPPAMPGAKRQARYVAKHKAAIAAKRHARAGKVASPFAGLI